jgi:hypothetical protein
MNRRVMMVVFLEESCGRYRKRKNRAELDPAGISPAYLKNLRGSLACPTAGEREEAGRSGKSRGTCGRGATKRSRSGTTTTQSACCAIVERNALRAELVARAEDWKWSSLPGWKVGDALLWRGAVPDRDSQWL